MPYPADSAPTIETAKPLFVVEGVFDVAYRGAMLVPPLPKDAARPGTFQVELVRPDGTRILRTATATASFSAPSRFPDHPVWVCLLDGRRGDVPVGTEVWPHDEHR